MTKVLRVLVAVGLFLPGLAFGQTVGSLTGHVYDQTGVPIRGVAITIMSPTQIGGPKTTTTADDGGFRFNGLAPGKFSVTASAPKLRTVTQPEVGIMINATIDIDLIMEVETSVEEIKIVEKAPVVNTTRSSIGETFDQDFVNELPLTSRDYQGVAALTAGVSDLGGTGNPNVRGGTYFANSYSVDGFQTTDPVTHTFGQNFSFDAMAQVEVQTAAFGAENSSVTGGLTNIVTKSGSNRFEADGTLTYTDQHLRFFKDARDIGTNRGMSASVNVGGPIQKDKIWFFVSAEGINSVFTLPRDSRFPDHPPFSVLGLNTIAKLTWQATPRNKIELKGIFSPGDFRNEIQSYLVEPEAEARQYQSTRFLGLSWQSLLTDNLFLVSRAGYQEMYFDVGPESCLWDPGQCANIAPQRDLATGISRQNYSSQSVQYRRTFELSGHLEWFKDTKGFGNHALKLGARYLGMSSPSASTVPGDGILRTLGSEPYNQTVVCANDPKLSQGECRPGWLRSVVTGSESLVFLNDAWKPTRYLTITPGVAMHLGHSEDDRHTKVTNITAFSPHLSAVWDATHDGRTVVRSSVNNYVDTGFLALAKFTSRSLYRKTCNWDPEVQAYVRNCISSGGNSGTTAGLPCGPEGVNPDGSRCTSPLRPPRVWEYTLGFEREILTGISLGADFIYRKFVHQWEDVETNAIWNQGGTGLRRESNFRSGRSEFVFDLQTPEAAQRRYKGLTTTLRKKEGLLKVMASYTWSRTEGTDDSSFATAFLDNPGQSAYYYGPLPADVRHDIRLQANYHFRPWVSAGVVYEFISGRPYNRFSFDSVYQDYSRFTAKRGFDSRGNLNPDDDVELRTPDLSSLNLQARFNLKPLIGQNVQVFADIFNVLALRTTTDYIEQDGPFWGQPAGRLPPTSARMGLEYRF